MQASVTVRFPHIDAAGIMFYPRYFELLLARFGRSPLTDTPQAMKTRFLRPNRLGDVLDIEFEPGAAWSYSGRTDGQLHFRVEAIEAAAIEPASPNFRGEARRVDEWVCGPDRHMLLSRIFELVNITVEEFMESSLRMSFAEMHIGRRVGIPTAEFRTQLRALPALGDTIEMTTELLHIGTKSLRLRHRLERGAECLVQNDQVLVFASMRDGGFETVAIPDAMRSKFEECRHVAA